MRNLIAMVVAFAAGALLMIALRGSGTGHAAGLHEGEHAGADHGEAPGAAHAGSEGHAAHGTEAAKEERAAEGEQLAHAGQGAVAGQVAEGNQIAQAAPPAEAAEKEAAGAATKTVELWVCAQDDKYALSYEGDCPLDGKPMVKKAVNVAALRDLKNERCPIMGGKTKDDVYAVYDGAVVHFCCPGCDGKFFQAPAEHIEKLSEKK